MSRYTELPDSLQKIHHSLEPYIKERHEAIRIRQILAAHLSTHVHQKGYPIFQPLSLIEASPSAEASFKGFGGLQKEYIRCLGTNIRARKEYSKTSKEHQLKSTAHTQSRDATRDILQARGNSKLPSSAFIDIVKYRRKHERLRVMQDYVDAVAQKDPATIDQLASRVALKNIGSLPQVPPDVMGTAETHAGSEKTDLKDLVNQLEKAVFRAKLLLQKEQKLLAKIKSHNNPPTNPLPGPGEKLQALGIARNELISWIELELAKTADGSPDSEAPVQIRAPEDEDEGFVENVVISIQRQYGLYSKLRRILILAATGHLDQPAPTKFTQDSDEVEASSATHNSESIIHIMHSYLAEMVSMSNEQKAMIQQKSYFTISLAKHLKEAGQGVERLSEESHLLPAHPMPGTSSQGNAFDTLASFGGSISNNEMPDSSRKARAWVFAADSARAATRAAVSEKAEEGRMDVLEAQHTLLELQRLLGEGGNSDQRTGIEPAKKSRQTSTGDIWASLAGNMGAIK
jgi:hypothetical protein